MENNNLLDQLKDIYLPPQISSWWPLAYGWWIVIAVLILLVLLALLVLRKRKKHKQYINTVVNDFKENLGAVYVTKPKEVVQSISVYLKRIAVHKFPKDEIKTLHGKAWVDYLESKTKKDVFDGEVTSYLTNTYKPYELDDSELEKIVSASEKWIRRVL
ncbi:DUF4381 domain-containing protein [Francisellaceae bacterium CB300]|jgi:LPXTG-motif cell wall-anchored protein